MANITINNTDKSGWMHLCLNDYYNGTNGDSEHYTPIEHGIGGICIGKIDGVQYIELHIKHESESFYLTNAGTNPNIKIVDTVNGVAPTSFDDLRDKILALFP